MGCSFSFSSFRHVGVMGSFLVWERSRKGAEWQENYGATEGEKEGQGSPQPHLENDSSPRQPSPHLILGCPVVMFFNYVSLFNVAAAHPYLVNRCNFSCRVEMQPSHPGIKGQIELPRAHTHTHTHTHTQRQREREREIYIYFYILSGYICNLSHNREIFSMPSNFQGKCEVWQFIHCTWDILFLSAL